MLNRLTARVREFLLYEVAWLPIGIMAAAAGVVWHGSIGAGAALCFLVLIHSKESLIASVLDVFKKPTAVPVDDQKLLAVVNSLNKTHSNQKMLDEKIQQLEGALGKLNLRFALKPLNNDVDA